MSKSPSKQCPFKSHDVPTEHVLGAPVQLDFDVLAALGLFLVPFWRPLDFEGVPKSTIFETSQKQMRKMRSKKRVGQIMICSLIFHAKIGGLKL